LILNYQIFQQSIIVHWLWKLDILLDLLEHGQDTFTNQYMMIEDNHQRRDIMNLVAGQVIQNKDFGEKFNTLMIELEMMLSYTSMEDF
jgi:hypothetical protein